MDPSLSSSAFSDWPEELKKSLEAIGRRLSVSRHTLLIEENSRSNEVYVVLSGEFRATNFAINGKEVIFRTIEAGEIFGEYAALDGSVRSSTVIASRNSETLVIGGRDFLEALLADRASSLWMMRRLARQLRSLTERIFELGAMKVSARVLCEILRLAESGQAVEQGILVTPAPTQSEIAARIGTSRETVSRELGRLTRSAQVEVKRGDLIIRDLAVIYERLDQELDA